MFYLILLIIAIPSFISLLNPWYFSMHDSSHVARLFLLDQAVHQGNLYPRWVDVFGFGFGYPLYNFYPPLVYYIGLIFRVLGMTYIWSVKLILISGFVLAALGIYAWMRRKIGNLPALVAATLYTYTSYHAVNAYVRGALAEFFSMALLPFIFWSLDLLAEKPTVKRTLFFASSLAALMLTHPLIALPSSIFIGIYIIFSIFNVRNKVKYLVHITGGGLLGLGLSSFFWLPAMAERKFTLVKSLSISELFDYRLHFVDLYQYWFSPWGFGGSVAGLNDGLSFQLGKIHIGLVVFSFVLFLILIIKKKLNTEYRIRYTAYVVMLLLSLFLTTNYSKFVWESFPLLQYLQFPWRFLTFSGLFISVLGGYFVYFIHESLSSSRVWGSKNGKLILFTSLIIISGIIFQYHKYFKPESYVKKTDMELTSFEEIAWNMSERTYDFIPEGVPLKKTQYGSSAVDIERAGIPYTVYRIPNTKTNIHQEKINFNEKSFRIKAPKPFVFTLNTFNFPGWTARIDGGQLPISDENKYKLITVDVPAGVHNLEFRFEDTPIRKWSNSVSLASLAGAILLLGVGKFKKRIS